MQAKSTASEKLGQKTLWDGQKEDRHMFPVQDILWLRDALRGKVAEFDSWQRAEIVVMFLKSRGYGVSHQTACDSIVRLEASNCRDDVVVEELESLALVN
jgi:hypothetical protein